MPLLVETLIWFIIALLVLAKASHWVIKASIQVAEHFGIATAAVGFIIISVFTSLPELMVATTAASVGKGGLAVGNVIGANIANICLVLGAAVIFKSINMKRKQIFENAEILLLITLMPLILLMRGQGQIGLWEGLLLLSIFVLYCIFVVKERFSLRIKDGIPLFPWVKTNVYMWGGMTVVIISAHYVVEYAVAISQVVGVPESLIGVTLVSVGTTLPELSTSITAVRKGHTGLAVGEILGSCVTNLTLILGFAAVVNPISADFAVFTTSIVFLVGMNILLWYLLVKYEKLTRSHGLLFIFIYIAFLLTEIIMV